ncbi:MAG: histidine phosphatase family protein [Lachnospiraceae bacterium]|nr:histidine phosphatase family protein [Lachnospiraceae bacterium]
MRLIIIRHGEPDYEHDTLTEKGWREAALLADRISRLDVKEFYVSPLGRAKATASLTLEKMGRTAVECPWLREFAPQIMRPDVPDHTMISWDWLPQDWTEVDEFYRRDQWSTPPVMREAVATDPVTGEQRVGIQEEYDWVVRGFDSILAEHGYQRKGGFYRTRQSNQDTLVFFCHFGVECVLLSHLLGISPMVLWHGTVAAPTSVTILYTEERRRSRVSFRMACFGDISHLYEAEEEPSFSARFCETYSSQERHD